MFLTIPPAEPVKFQTPEYIKAITLRISDIQPCGTIMIYSTPFPGLPARFDAEHPEQRIATTSNLIWTQKMEGAESFNLEMVGFECDPEAEAEAREPKPIRWGG
jgi:hypothetical protein